MDAWGFYETPCPCGGRVDWWRFGADCRGNAPSSGITCHSCHREFTAAQWKEVENGRAGATPVQD